jgi:hypothetical protein
MINLSHTVFKIYDKFKQYLKCVTNFAVLIENIGQI